MTVKTTTERARGEGALSSSLPWSPWCGVGEPVYRVTTPDERPPYATRMCRMCAVILREAGYILEEYR